MKNNAASAVPQSAVGVKPNNRQDPEDVVNTNTAFSRAGGEKKKQSAVPVGQEETLKSAPSKAKVKRAKRAQKLAAQKRAAQKAADFEAGKPIEISVPADGVAADATVGVDKIRIRLEDDDAEPLHVHGGCSCGAAHCGKK